MARAIIHHSRQYLINGSSCGQMEEQPLSFFGKTPWRYSAASWQHNEEKVQKLTGKNLSHKLLYQCSTHCEK
jgi:hypothetical protein